jgi:hypothetical protein
MTKNGSGVSAVPHMDQRKAVSDHGSVQKLGQFRDVTKCISWLAVQACNSRSQKPRCDK